MKSYLVGMRNALMSLALAVGVMFTGCAPTTQRLLPSVVAVLGPSVPNVEAPKPASAKLHMDVDFTPAERVQMQLAADIWRKQTSGQAFITLVYDLDFSDPIGLQQHILDHDDLVMRATDDLTIVAMEDGDEPGSVLGWMTSGGIHNPDREPIHGAFVVDRMEDNDVFLQVVVHEFGHVLGLPHDPARQSVMYPSVNVKRSACLKRADLASFCTINGCDGRPLYPCE